MKKLGYQGIKYSNNYDAALKFAETFKEENLQLIPLISSSNVFRALLAGEVDYGVVAFINSSGGVVEETRVALETGKYQLMEELPLKIAHHAFKLRDTIKNEEITHIYSHEQALRQCAKNIAEHFPNAELIPEKNTAVAAKLLGEGAYGNTAAALCTLAAGEHYRLHLAQEEVQDSDDNTTTFHLYSF